MGSQNEYKRGTTGVAYGLVVGLIGIVALAAITTSGSSINALFDETASTLGDVVTEEPTPEPTPEVTLDAFDFADVSGASSSTPTQSAPLNITGSFTSAPVTVSGGSNTRFRINGGSWVTSGSVMPGDQLELITDSSPSASGSQVVTVTVGSVSDTWTVTTRGDCQGGRCIFFTSTTYNGNLGGGVGSDAFCQARADAVGLTGTFYALLSPSNPSDNAADRFTWNAPYYSLDGNLVSNSAWPYTSGWSNRVTDENGVVLTGSFEFWTNGQGSGLACGSSTSTPNNNCQSFTSASSSFNGITGYYNGSTVQHLCWAWRSCTTAYRLLCVEE